MEPKYAMLLLIAGCIMFLLGMMWVAHLLGLRETGLIIVLLTTIGLLIAIAGGVELNYWATRYWDEHEEEAKSR